MNKLLYSIFLFVLNNSSRAQCISSRDISIITLKPILFLCIFPLVLFAQPAFSVDYYWRSSYYNQLRFGNSPNTSCFAQSDVFSVSAKFTITGTTFSSTTVGVCTFSYLYAGQYPSIDKINLQRFGDSCPPGNVYNNTTGECAMDEQKGPPGSCPTGFAGGPINTANGNSYQVETDYPSNSLSTLSFTRTYNSLDGLWRHNHSTYLRFAGTNVALVMHHGRESFFTVIGSTVTAAPTELGSLVKTTDGWLYSAENSERYTFDASGRLIRWANTAGAEQQLIYANGKVTVIDHLGQSLSFTEDAQHQPLTLTAPSLTIKYDYNATKHLTQLTRTRDGQTEQRQFHYEDSRNNALLTGLTDERGVRYTTWTFDEKGRATSSEYTGGAEHTQVAYSADGSSTVTNELGKSTVYRFVSIGGIKRVLAVEGEVSANCPNSNSTFTYDTRGLLKTKTDNKGFVTTYDYNERGLEVSRTEASGTAQARTTTTTWHVTLNLPLTVTELGSVTHYQYDTQGRQLSRTVRVR